MLGGSKDAKLSPSGEEGKSLGFPGRWHLSQVSKVGRKAALLGFVLWEDIYSTEPQAPTQVSSGNHKCAGSDSNTRGTRDSGRGRGQEERALA